MIKAIDLFAGAGGFTEGASRVEGVDVVWAANHWPLACRTHKANHPRTKVKCQDLKQANWTKVPKCDLVIASPCCQGHSDAKGADSPEYDESRSTAWAVVDCCDYMLPKTIIVENVTNFRDKWRLYPVWRLALETLGYHLTETVIDAADCGVPQERKRLFIVGRQDRPAVIPQPNMPHVAADEIIEWNSKRWSKINKPGRAQATKDRIKSGRRRFGNRFLAPFYGSGSGKTGRSIDRPVGTITTLDRWSVINGYRMRMLNVNEYRAAMGFDPDYQLGRTRRESIHLLGNAVCPPVAEYVIKHAIN